jgi:hypothetical protein
VNFRAFFAAVVLEVNKLAACTIMFLEARSVCPDNG